MATIEQTRVPVGRIEAGLAALWERLGQGDPQASVVRACMGTLIVTCSPDSPVEDVTAAIAKLVPAHPARVVVLQCGGAGGIEALLSAHCAARRGNRQVCCEQITLRAGRDGLGNLALAVLPVLVADLPVVLWAAEPDWAGPPDHLADLMAHVDRVIVDTRLAGDPAAAWSICHRKAAGRQLHCSVSDLTWSRLAPWRHATAQLFDSPQTVAQLQRIRRLTVRWVRSDPPAVGRPAALLTAGWLAARLGWTLQRVDRSAEPARTLHLHAGGRDVQAVCEPGEIGLPQCRGDLSAIVIETEDDRFCVQRTCEPDQLRLRLGGPSPLEVTVSLPVLDTGQLLLTELEADPRDQTYQSALAVALPAAMPQ